MKRMTEKQRKIAFKNLMDSKKFSPGREIESPSSEAYRQRREKINERIQQGMANYAEAYINSIIFFID